MIVGAREISVDCLFEESGRVRLRRIRDGDQWQAVQQGRQWRDQDGLHVMILLPQGIIREILFSAQVLGWLLLPQRNEPPIVI